MTGRYSDAIYRNQETSRVFLVSSPRVVIGAVGRVIENIDGEFHGEEAEM